MNNLILTEQTKNFIFQIGNFTFGVCRRRDAENRFYYWIQARLASLSDFYSPCLSFVCDYSRTLSGTEVFASCFRGQEYDPVQAYNTIAIQL